MTIEIYYVGKQEFQEQIPLADVPNNATYIICSSLKYFCEPRLQNLTDATTNDCDQILNQIVIDSDSIEYIGSSHEIFMSFVAFRCHATNYMNYFDSDKTSSVAILSEVKEDLYRWIQKSESIKNVFVSSQIMSNSHIVQSLVENIEQSGKKVTVVDPHADFLNDGKELVVESDYHLSEDWLKLCECAKIENVIVNGDKCPIELERVRGVKFKIKREFEKTLEQHQTIVSITQQKRSIRAVMTSCLEQLCAQIKDIANTQSILIKVNVPQ